MRLGSILKKWRFMMTLGTREACVLLGISDGALRRIEAGGIPDGETLIKLWSVLTSPEPVEAANGTDPNQRAVANPEPEPGRKTSAQKEKG